MLIKADINDLQIILKLYGEVLDVPDNCRYSNWEKGLYPTEDTAKNAVEKGNLYLFYEGSLFCGSVILDEELPDDYKKIAWRFSAPPHKILTLHTLCIAPSLAGHGCGSRLLADIERFGRENGYDTIRLDTHNDNLPAQRLYSKNGFRDAGAADVFIYGKTRRLRCFEKQLQQNEIKY